MEYSPEELDLMKKLEPRVGPGMARQIIDRRKQRPEDQPWLSLGTAEPAPRPMDLLREQVNSMPGPHPQDPIVQRMIAQAIPRTPADERPAPSAPPTKSEAVRSFIAKKYGFGEDLDDAAIAAAQEAARRDRRFADLTEGAARIGAALGGIKHDPTHFDQIRKGADQSVQDILVRREALGQEQKFKDTQEAQDPDSALNRAFRASIGQFLPKVAKMEGFNSLTVANAGPLEKMAQLFVSQYNADANRAASAEYRATSLGMRDRELRERDARAAEQKIRDHAKDLSRSGIPKILSLLDRIDSTLGSAKESGDIPGYGRVESLRPSWSYSGGSKAETLRQDVQDLVNTLRHASFGSQLTKYEIAQAAEQFGTGKFRSEDALRNFLKRVRELTLADLASREAGLGPEHLEQYASRPGATTSRRAKGKIVVSDGKETLEIDPSDLPEAEAEGFKRIR